MARPAPCPASRSSSRPTRQRLDAEPPAPTGDGPGYGEGGPGWIVTCREERRTADRVSKKGGPLIGYRADG